MELSERKNRILRAIVESYTQTGEPVGSKTLLTETGIDVSPATVRNDMADLLKKGYLYQPHTSAGRAPTVSGYRYYIDNLMTPKAPSQRACDYIDAKLSSAADTPENLLRCAAQLLSDYTGFAAVTTTPPSEDARVHRLHFIGTGRHTAMAVLVTTTGMVKTKLFRCNFVVTSDILEILNKLLNKALSGVPLRELTRPFIQTIAASFGDIFLLTSQALVAIMEIAHSAQETKLCTAGQTKLLFMPDVEMYTARGIMSFLSDGDEVAKLVLAVSNGTKILLGSECRSKDLASAAVITSRYEIAGKAAGAVALFAPMRTDYPAAVGAVSYISQAVSNFLDEMVDI